jgi:hypothetical protein
MKLPTSPGAVLRHDLYAHAPRLADFTPDARAARRSVVLHGLPDHTVHLAPRIRRARTPRSTNECLHLDRLSRLARSRTSPLWWSRRLWTSCRVAPIQSGSTKRSSSSRPSATRDVVAKPATRSSTTATRVRPSSTTESGGAIFGGWTRTTPGCSSSTSLPIRTSLPKGKNTGDKRYVT